MNDQTQTIPCTIELVATEGGIIEVRHSGRGVPALFKNEHLSVSRLRKYEECPRAFFYQYVDKNGPKMPRGLASLFGIVLHAALEAVYAWIVDQEYAGPFPTAELTQAYRDAWQTSELTNVSLYQEGLTILRRFAAQQVTVDHFQILGIETEFNLTVDGFVLNGYIDRIDRIDDTTIEIVDYKSNQSLYTREELERDLQMSIYGLAARTLFPWATTVRFAFHMLRFATVQRTTRTPEAIDDARGYLVALGRRSEQDQTWKAQIHPNCGYCDHRARCDAYQELLQSKYPIARAAAMDDLAEVVRERAEVAKVAKIAYSRRDELDAVLRAKLAQEGEFEAGNFKVRFLNSEQRSWTTSQVFQAAEMVGVSPATIDRLLPVTVGPGDVDALLLRIETTLGARTALLLRTTLEALAQTTPATPRLDVRAIKKGGPK